MSASCEFSEVIFMRVYLFLLAMHVVTCVSVITFFMNLAHADNIQKGTNDMYVEDGFLEYASAYAAL